MKARNLSLTQRSQTGTGQNLNPLASRGVRTVLAEVEPGLEMMVRDYMCHCLAVART